MYGIDNSTSVGSEPARPAAATQGFFTDADPATIVSPWWLNMVQNELKAVLAAAGLTPDKDDDTQLAQAIAVLATASISTSVLQAQAGNYAADSGSANAYAVTLTPALVAHVTGMPIRVKIANTNTGASTFNPGPGVKSIVGPGAVALSAADLVAGEIVEFIYDGTNYQYRRLALAKRFESNAAGLTVPASGRSAPPLHGLGARPRTVGAYIRCVTAELSYTVGECVPIGSAFSDSGSSRGTSIVFDTLNIGIIVAPGGIRIPHGSSGTVSAITEANWKLHLFAAL